MSVDTHARTHTTTITSRVRFTHPIERDQRPFHVRSLTLLRVHKVNGQKLHSHLKSKSETERDKMKYKHTH